MISFRTLFPADWLMETSNITAHTPITMPNTVKAARILFFANARRATRMMINIFIINLGNRRVRACTHAIARKNTIRACKHAPYLLFSQ